MGKSLESVQSKKTLEAIDERDRKSKLNLNDIVIPLLLGVVLIIIGFFVFIPMIKSAISFRQEYTDVKAKEVQLTELKKSLTSIDEGIIQVDLLNAKSVIPKTLRVSSFIYYIDELAKTMNLSSKTLSAGDTQLSIGGDDTKKEYLGVNGPLAYSGTLDEILKFLDSIYSASPYIISADNVILTNSVSDTWKVSLNITGYYVPEKSYNIDIYEPFTSYTSYNEIVSVFEEKALKLKD